MVIADLGGFTKVDRYASISCKKRVELTLPLEAAINACNISEVCQGIVEPWCNPSGPVWECTLLELQPDKYDTTECIYRKMAGKGLC